jgi:hypothetical protein
MGVELHVWVVGRGWGWNAQGGVQKKGAEKEDMQNLKCGNRGQAEVEAQGRAPLPTSASVPLPRLPSRLLSAMPLLLNWLELLRNIDGEEETVGALRRSCRRSPAERRRREKRRGRGEAASERASRVVTPRYDTEVSPTGLNTRLPGRGAVAGGMMLPRLNCPPAAV